MAVTEITNRQTQAVIAGHVAGVNWGQQFIAEEMFPPANTYGEKFIYETRGNEGLQDVSGGERALGADTAHVDHTQVGTAEGALAEYAFETSYDYRLINADNVADMLRGATPAGTLSTADSRRLGNATNLDRKIMILKEKAAALLGFGTANYVSSLWYGTGGGSAVVDFAASGIIRKFAEVRYAVAQLFGQEPDLLVLGNTKYLDLWANAEILARITGGANNTNPAKVNDELLAGMLGVAKIVTAKAFTQPVTAAGVAPASSTPIWTATSAALVYSGVGQTADLHSPAFGKTFYMDVPETAVRQDVRTYTSLNGKLEHIEVTEFFKIAQTMKAGAIFTT